MVQLARVVVVVRVWCVCGVSVGGWWQHVDRQDSLHIDHRYYHISAILLTSFIRSYHGFTSVSAIISL